MSERMKDILTNIIVGVLVFGPIAVLTFSTGPICR
jgi:hypothetical protein